MMMQIGQNQDTDKKKKKGENTGCCWIPARTSEEKLLILFDKTLVVMHYIKHTVVTLYSKFPNYFLMCVYQLAVTFVSLYEDGFSYSNLMCMPSFIRKSRLGLLQQFIFLLFMLWCMAFAVAAVSDGLKAWEILKEKPQTIDVVLAEVEVPSVSGINLLSMIMEHEICKHIPVIMMSSHDSINMVFKCMLKGAADFLVKPIRRNELRNLWQHVWRRHSSRDGHGGTKLNQDDNAKNKIEATSRKANLSSGFVPYVKNKKECSEKESDAQGSCTKSDMEAESTYKQNSVEPQQTTCKGFPVLRDEIRHNAEEKIQPNRSLLDHVCKHEECTPFNETSIANEQLLEEECSCALVGTANTDVKPMGALYNNSITNEMEGQTYDQGTPPKQIIDLIGAIGNQRQFGYRTRENSAISNNLYDAPDVVFHDEDFSCKSSSATFLELSLRRYPHTSVDKEEKNFHSTLNHSDSSAFSLYNSRTPVSTLSRTVNFQAEGEEYYCSSTKQIPDKGFGNCNNVPRCTGTAQHINTEDAKSPSPGASSKNRIAIKCFPIRVIPIPIPIGGMNFNTVMLPFLRLESSDHLLWSSGPSKGQEAVCLNVSHQSDTTDPHTCYQHPLNQSPKGPILHSAQMEHGKRNTELREEPWHVACATGDSASSSICYGSAGHHHIDSNGLGRIFNETNGNISHVASELRNQEEKKSADLYRLNQREAALNKFRLKRKERCYEKKVRYQSRKRLAEQRPRVKGQFVRHIQPDASSVSVEAASSQVEPAVG